MLKIHQGFLYALEYKSNITHTHTHTHKHTHTQNFMIWTTSVISAASLKTLLCVPMHKPYSSMFDSQKYEAVYQFFCSLEGFHF